MILRVVSGSTLRVIEIDDVSQVVVLADTGTPVACAHETPSGAIIATHAGSDDFAKTLTSLGVNPPEVKTLE